MPPRISLSLVFHNHQPVGNFGWVLQEVYELAYEPMVAALERHPGVRAGLHYTGPLLEWLRAEHPEFLDRVRALVARGQVEILGGGYYEPVLASLPERDRQGQLRRMVDELEREFGTRPRGAWLAERVWEPSLPFDLARGGYEYTILDDNHLRAASVKEDAMWAPFTTDDQGERLTIFASEQGLRYGIPWHDVDQVIEYLRTNATEAGDRVGMMGDDGEKFGAWPGTAELCWGENGWVDAFFAAIEANADWLSTTTPSGWLDEHPPVQRVYVPTSSYVEMTQWALPADEAATFEQLIQDARERASPEFRFLRGGLWRNFQARYSEVNDLHKRMLRASARVAAMPPGPDRERALDHLYQGQSNDCYWHGLFGGIYIVHMRMATLQHLLAAEDLADAAARAGGDQGVTSPDGTFVEDLDLDGVDEVLLSGPGYAVRIDPQDGGGIRGWDLRASRVAALSVIRRREEAYHEALSAYDRAVATAGGKKKTAGSSNPHQNVRVKEPNLSHRLWYDRHERVSGLVRLFPSTTSREDLESAQELELGGLAADAWTVDDAREGAVSLLRSGTLNDRGAALTARKEIRAGGDRGAPWLEVEVTLSADAPIACDLGLEWSFNMSGGGGNPGAYYLFPRDDGTEPERLTHDSTGTVDEASRVVFGNDDDGVRITATPDAAARVDWYPVETISNSESGYERVYQGSCLVFRWPLELRAGGSVTRSVRFEARESRDLAAEETAGTGAASTEGAVSDAYDAEAAMARSTAAGTTGR